MDAFLAFILLVFVVSMATTVVVQVWLDITNKRGKCLKKMLVEYYHGGFVPAIRRKFETPNLTLPTDQINQLNRDLTGLISPAVDGGVNALKRPSSIVAEISRESFVARLQASSAGLWIKESVEDLEKKENPGISDEEVGKKVEEFFGELAERFDVFAERASESFRRHARSASIVVGFLVAFLFNIDGLNTIQRLIGSPSLRTAIVSSDKDLINSLKKIERQLRPIKRVETTVKTLEKKLEKAKLDSADDRNKLKLAVDNLASRLVNLQEKLSESDLFLTETNIDLQAAIVSTNAAHRDSLAFGWSSWPICDVKTDMRCQIGNYSPAWWRAVAVWFVGVLFTGLLAGLGAPFWYDMIKAVSRVWRISKDPKSAATT